MHNGNNSAEIGRGNDAVKIDEAGRLKKRLIARKGAATLDVSNCRKKNILKQTMKMIQHQQVIRLRLQLIF